MRRTTFDARGRGRGDGRIGRSIKMTCDIGHYIIHDPLFRPPCYTILTVCNAHKEREPAFTYTQSLARRSGTRDANNATSGRLLCARTAIYIRALKSFHGARPGKPREQRVRDRYRYTRAHQRQKAAAFLWRRAMMIIMMIVCTVSARGKGTVISLFYARPC